MSSCAFYSISIRTGQEQNENAALFHAQRVIAPDTTNRDGLEARLLRVIGADEFASADDPTSLAAFGASFRHFHYRAEAKRLPCGTL
jgi:hypothetical protein